MSYLIRAFLCFSLVVVFSRNFLIRAVAAGDEVPLDRKTELGAPPKTFDLTPKPQINPAWKHRFQDELTQDYKGTEVVFFGDSITEGWKGNGSPYWNQFFLKSNPVNFGYSSDKIENVLWRLENGNLASILPKAIVLLIGTNNLMSVKSNEDLVQGIFTLLGAIHRISPASKILVLGILPRIDTEVTARILEINSILETRVREFQEEDGPALVYLDSSEDFFDSKKHKLREERFVPDKTHLSALGYQALGKRIEPVLKALLLERKPSSKISEHPLQHAKKEKDQ